MALAHLKSQAAAQFDALGWPNRRVEQYKYSDLSAMGKADLTASQIQVSVSIPEQTGLSVSKLDQVDEDVAALVGSVLPLNDALAALNGSQVDDAFVVQISQSLAEPVELRFTADATTYPRVLVLVGEGVEASLVETYEGTGICAPAIEVILDQGAKLNHLRAQTCSDEATHLSSTAAKIAADATYSHFALNLGGKLTRNNIRASLDGEGAHVDLLGLHLLSGNQHCDTASFIDHASAKTTSNEIYKSVVSGSANSVFQGKIHVAKDSQKIEGNQMSRGLLLGDRARVNNKPELEIYADDVICSHGSTVGAIEDSMLFYLRARGIPEAQARRMMIEAFVNEIFDEAGDVAGLEDLWRAPVDAYLTDLVTD